VTDGTAGAAAAACYADPPVTRLRLLIVEDDPDIVEALVMGLEDRYQVLVAPHGRGALDVMAAQGADVVIVDLMMPVLDGEGYMAEHRVRYPAVPVLLISAGRDISAIAARLGAADWIAKPFSLTALEERVQRLAAAVAEPRR
jgi:two-component system, chemotaxis family, chemotaxis protein CheY